MMYNMHQIISIGGNNIMKQIKAHLTHYVEEILNLSSQEYLTEFVQLGVEELAWGERKIPKKLKGAIIDTYTFYNHSLIKDYIYSFIGTYQGKIILLGYTNGEYEHFFYINDTDKTLHSELHLLNLTEEDLEFVNVG